MLETIALGFMLIILVFLMVLATAGNPEGFWILGTVGVQIILLILGIIGIVGILEMLGGIAILGGITGLSLFVIPFLY